MPSIPYRAGQKHASRILGLLRENPELSVLLPGLAIGGAIGGVELLKGRDPSPPMGRPYLETANPLEYQPRS